MPYRIVFTDRHTRAATRFLKRRPDMARAYEKTLELLMLARTNRPCACMR